nr:unnamed protein product [Callosobruchus chinensis]
MQEHLNKLCESDESSASSGTSKVLEAKSATLKIIEPEVTIDDTEQTGQGFNALGLRPDSLGNLGKDLHEEIVVRWDNLLKKGLIRDQRDTLMAKYKIPANCKALQPPQINHEVQLIRSVVEHDRFISALQHQLAHGLTAVGTVLETMIGLPIICSVHRRFKIIPHLNPECKKVAETLEIDEFLFNTKFAEAMKNEQAIKKASVEFKKKSWQPSFPGPSGSGTANRYHLNYRRPLPKGRMKEKRKGREKAHGTKEVQGDFPGSREIIRQSYIKKGVPETAIEVITASLTKGTLRQYTACFRRFWQFCADYNRDPSNYNLETYLEFLSNTLSKGLIFCGKLL